MRILLLSHSALITGGAEQCLLEYVDILIKNGHTCKVIVPAGGDMVKALKRKDIQFEVVGYSWAIEPPEKAINHDILISNGHGIARIYTCAERFRPDVIITNTAVIPWGLYVGKALGIPNVLLIHEILNDKDPSLKMVPSYEEYMEIINNNADSVIFNSEFVKSEYMEVLTKPLIAEKILYPLPPLDKQAIERHYIPNMFVGNLKIALLGALSPRKNQLEALKAIKILKETGVSNVELDLYGSTSNKQYVKVLRDFIKEHDLSSLVRLKGYTQDPYETMCEYNVILSTATYEPFGRSLAEGQLFARLVISNETGGGSELVHDGKTGIIYKSGNPTQLAGKINWAIDHWEQSIGIGLNAQKKQLKEFLTTNRYDALINTIVSIREQKAYRGAEILVYDPIRSLVEYGDHFHHRFKRIERFYRNRVTRAPQAIVSRIKRLIKKSLKTALSVIPR